MGWSDYVLVGAALVTAVATVATAVIAWRLGHHRLRVRPRLERGKDGALALFVELVNTGGVPVAVEQVFLSAGGDDPAPAAHRLCDNRGYPVLPQRIEPRRKLTIGPVQATTVKAVRKLKRVTVVAKTEDGCVVKARCRGLRELYDEERAAPGVLPKP